MHYSTCTFHEVQNAYQRLKLWKCKPHVHMCLISKLTSRIFCSNCSTAPACFSKQENNYYTTLQKCNYHTCPSTVTWKYMYLLLYLPSFTCIWSNDNFFEYQFLLLIHINAFYSSEMYCTWYHTHWCNESKYQISSPIPLLS